MKHTSGIWKIVKGTEDNGGGAYAINSEPIIDGLEWNLATIWNAGDLDGVTAQANAERIVKAVNEYDETRKLMKDQVEIISAFNKRFEVDKKYMDKIEAENKISADQIKNSVIRGLELEGQVVKLREALKDCVKLLDDITAEGNAKLYRNDKIVIHQAKQALK